MKKLLSVGVLGAVLMTACGSGSGGSVAASVNGTDVTVADVEALIESEGETVNKQDFATFLAARIQWHIFFDAAEADYGVTVTEDEVAAEADRLVDQLATEGQTREDFLVERGITEEFLDNIARQSAVDVKIREVLREDVPEPTQDEIEEARRAARAQLTNACVSHILVATEEEAVDAMSRVEAGEEFGAVAGELSTDGSAANEGALGCGTLERYVPSFRDAAMEAPVGEMNPTPVQSQFGYHVILVTERTDADETALPAEEELVTDVEDAAIYAELQDWFLGIMEDATVTVDAEYGTWAPNPPTVTPPAD
jgi:parvulin-like peptidyl-prolyl isomerase